MAQSTIHRPHPVAAPQHHAAHPNHRHTHCTRWHTLARYHSKWRICRQSHRLLHRRRQRQHTTDLRFSLSSHSRTNQRHHRQPKQPETPNSSIRRIVYFTRMEWNTLFWRNFYQQRQQQRMAQRRRCCQRPRISKTQSNISQQLITLRKPCRLCRQKQPERTYRRALRQPRPLTRSRRLGRCRRHAPRVREVCAGQKLPYHHTLSLPTQRLHQYRSRFTRFSDSPPMCRRNRRTNLRHTTPLIRTTTTSTESQAFDYSADCTQT